MEKTQCRPRSNGAYLVGTNSAAAAATQTSYVKGGSWDDGH